MAAEYIYNDQQLVAFGSNLLLLDSIPCRNGFVLHDNGTGIITLRGIVNNPCSNFARYRVTCNCNIAIPDGGTIAPIAIAIAENGEEIPTSKAIVTPAAVEEFWNVSVDKLVTVARGCCPIVAIENVLPGIDPATEVGAAIIVRNLNVIVDRVA